MAIIKRPPTPQSLLKVDVSNPDIRNYDTMEKIHARATSLGIKTFPFDIITYLKRHGVKIDYEEMEDMSGYVRLRNGQYIVGLNQYQNETRQRFTAAHELAHIVKDTQAVANGDFYKNGGEMLLFRDNEGAGQIEQRANELASDILMPKSIFKSLVDDGVRNIEELATRFNVSPAAVKYRAYKLKYIPRY